MDAGGCLTYVAVESGQKLWITRSEWNGSGGFGAIDLQPEDAV